MPVNIEPKRETNSLARLAPAYPNSSRTGYMPRLDVTDHYAKSQLNLERVPRRLLRAFADTLPAQTAIRRITDGIVGMPWEVKPPKELKDSEEAHKRCEAIRKAIKRPNTQEHQTYSLFISSIVSEILITGQCPVERQAPLKNRSIEQPFWLWPCNSDYIHPNPDWNPQKAGIVPRYFDTSMGSGTSDRVPLLDSQMFRIQQRHNSWQLVPPSPLETAFRMISSWLGLSEYQSETTSSASQQYLIFLGEVSDKQIEGFKEFWHNEVQGTAETPIVGGKGKPEILKIGASADEGLYLSYCDYLLKMIALSFLLKPQDMNIEKETNFATAGISADASFQFAMAPLAKAIFEALQIEVMDYFVNGYLLELSDMEKRSEVDESTISNTLFTGNIATKNEARQRMGLPSLQGVGDHFADGSSIEEVPSVRQEQMKDDQTEGDSPFRKSADAEALNLPVDGKVNKKDAADEKRVIPIGKNQEVGGKPSSSQHRNLLKKKANIAAAQRISPPPPVKKRSSL